ncbi:retrovirus-related pol polyprotein from transposon TNT 1-94 [Tanacetum coccineum]
MFINHEKYTLVIVDEYSRMVENQNDVKVKQIRTKNRIEFRHHKLESFCNKKGISQNFSSPYTPEQNSIAERKNRTLTEAARIMLNGSDHLGKFNAKADDGYFLGYSSVSKAFRVYNTRRQQIKETYYVTFDESMEAIRCSLTEIIHENHVFEVIALNEPEIPHTKDDEGPPDPINTKGTHEQNVQNDQMSHITNQASTSSHHVPRDRWSRDQHIKLVNIIGDPSKGMLTRSMASKLTAASASECLFADFISETEPKKEEGIDYDETFVPVARMEAIKIFLAFSTYINFKVYQMDLKSAFLNGKLKEEVYVKQPPGFESSEFPDYVCKLDKALYGLKQAPRTWYETLSTFLIQQKFSRVRIDNTLFIYKSKGEVLLVQVYQSNPNESHLIAVKRIPRYLKGTPTLDLYYPKCSGFDLKGYSDSDYAVAMSSAEAEYVAAIGCCASILWMKSQLSDYDIHYKMVPIFCDNTSAIAISNNPILHSRTKHIDIRYHFIKDHILKGDIKLHFIPTEYQLADIFTKPLDEPTFTRLKARLGMLNID